MTYNSSMKAAANAFAMELLMPRKEMLKVKDIDLNDDIAVTKLAKKYRVSVPVMTARILSLRGSPQ